MKQVGLGIIDKKRCPGSEFLIWTAAGLARMVNRWSLKSWEWSWRDVEWKPTEIKLFEYCDLDAK